MDVTHSSACENNENSNASCLIDSVNLHSYDL